MQVGKGRSTNLMEINAFFAKLTAGTAAMCQNVVLSSQAADAALSFGPSATSSEARGAPPWQDSRPLLRSKDALSSLLRVRRHRHIVRVARRAAAGVVAAGGAALGVLLLGDRVVPPRHGRHEGAHHEHTPLSRHEAHLTGPV